MEEDKAMVNRVLTIDCVHVWQENSNYIEGEVNPELRTRMELHFKECKHCSAILDGTRNVVRLVGDGKAFDISDDTRGRLYSKLEKYLSGKKS